MLLFQGNLLRPSIDMQLRDVDVTQYTCRVRERDFDIILTVFIAMPFPTADLRIIWNSEYIYTRYNRLGVREPAVNSLVRQIA